MNSFDLSIETYLSNIHLGEFANLSIQAIDNLYTFKGLVLIPVLWWMWFQQDECREWRREMVLATLVSGIVALLVGRLLTHWLPFRVRPVYDTELHLRFASGEIKDAVLTNWSSFPSDHAMLWMAVATGIFLISRRVGRAGASLYCAVHLPSARLSRLSLSDRFAGGRRGGNRDYIGDDAGCDPRTLRDAGAAMDRTPPGARSDAGLYSVPPARHAVRRTAQAGEWRNETPMMAAMVAPGLFSWDGG
ncbi:hypothetical protein OKW37_007605 [Paraburkholderia sp. MM5482-R2]